MKKILILLMCAALVCGVCGCGEEEVTNSKVKIGLICVHNEQSTYDLNFITGLKEACEAKGVPYAIKTNINESEKCLTAAEELVEDEGCNIIFGDSFGHEPYLLEAAKEYPNVQFCHSTGTLAHTSGLDNMHNTFAAIYDGRYLDGVALGMKLAEMGYGDDAKVGYVGAFQYAEVISGYTAFYLGVRSILPNATMEVTFTGSWYDETLEKEAAFTLVKNGCVGISGHADSLGIPTACEQMGVPFVFYNGDVSNVSPNTFIVGTRIDWKPYFEYIIDCVTNDELIVGDYVATIAEGGILMTDVNEKAAAAGTALKIKEVMDKLANNEIYVFDTNNFTVNGEKLEYYMADVDSDEKYEPDTQVIMGGIFMESCYRSAPYFDLTIDGIIIK